MDPDPPNVSGATRPIRRKPVHGVFTIQGNPTLVFVTVCTRNRDPWLANTRYQHALFNIWHVEATAWRVGHYILMPDHLHFIAGQAEPGCTLEKWMRFWKRRFIQVTGLPARSVQENHWDVRLRTAKHYEEKWRYMVLNPVRKKLVVEPEEWPFTGVVHELSW